MLDLGEREWPAREVRHPVSLRAFALNDRRDADIVLTDLSYSGCQIRSSEDFAVGEKLQLRVIKRGLIQAEIRWARTGKAGAQFLE